MLASLARQNVRPSKAVNDASYLGQRLGGVGTGLLQIVRELSAQMADQPPGKCAGERNRTCLGGHMLLAIFADRIRRERAGRVEEHIVQSGIPRSAEAGGKCFVWRVREIHFEEAGITNHLRRIRSGQVRQSGGGGEHQCLVAGLIVAILQRLLAGLRGDLGTSIQKTPHSGDMKNVLVESAKKEHAIVTQWTTQCESELLLF